MPQYASVLELSSLNGANGFQLNGEAAGDQSGFSVSSAGDVNGDGFADLIVGARYADPNGAISGASYVVFGKASGFAATLELSSLNGANGFQINGEAADDWSGFSVASAGDVNGDGFADLIVGAPHAISAYSYNPLHGISYVVFGKASGFASTLELSSLNGANGFQINGVSPGDESGRSVASAGDINGDGFDDLIVGADRADPNGNQSGASYVVFGKASGFAFALELSSLNGVNGFQINGEAAGDQNGVRVSSAGDFNGDGFDDLIVGAVGADPNGSFSGASYVVFGKASGFGATFELSSLNGANGFQINGEAEYDVSGSVSSAGDLNGDGFDDLIVGANGADPNGNSSGASYVVFGKASGFAATLELSSLNGANGFQINGEAGDDRSGYSVATAGDFNGDGFDDLIVGAYSADPNGGLSGASYVVFGKALGFVATLELSSLDGNSGFQINGEAGGDESGHSVAAAGDVNGDGFDDLIVGALGADPNGASSGASYVIFGFMPGEAVARTGTAIANIIHGGNFADTLNGLGGADILFGHGGIDILDGGADSDTLNGGTGADIMLGGNGNDTYIVDNAGDVTTEASAGGGFDLVRSSVTRTLGAHFENLTLTGGAVINVTGNELANVLTGNSAANSLNGMGGADVMVGGGGNDTYFVNSTFDVTTETSALDGIDLVRSAVTRALGANLENLILTGSTAINGTGNSLANILTGNAFANVLAGGDGADKLTGGNGGDTLRGGLGIDRLIGGNGADKFVFNTAPAGADRDIITDFNLVGDTIQLENSVFAGVGGPGVLAAAAFRIGAAAADASDRIIYNAANGRLSYDADGAGGAAQIWFATLTAGLALTNADFVVI